MKKRYLYLAAIAVTSGIIVACNSSAANKKIVGKWYAEDKKTNLQITAKEFILDEGEPLAESYFTKGDSIYTSYEGSEPYTKFIVQNLTDKSMTLIYPDSTSVKFFR